LSAVRFVESFKAVNFLADKLRIVGIGGAWEDFGRQLGNQKVLIFDLIRQRLGFFGRRIQLALGAVQPVLHFQPLDLGVLEKRIDRRFGLSILTVMAHFFNE
jgi:hypothetical protein